MNVPLIDLSAQYSLIKKEIEPIILEILSSQNLVLGEYNRKIEGGIAKLCGVKYTVAVASGTDALILALKSAGLPEGSEVITSAYSFFSSASSILLAGLKPVFVDIDPETYNLDPSRLEEIITGRTKGILPVHLFGQCADMRTIDSVAEEKNIVVIEDVAQSILAEINGKKAGTFGIAGTLSFYPSKNLGAFGDAGMVLTNDPRIYEKVRLLHVHGSKGGYIHEEIGYNSRMDEINAAALFVKLKYIELWTQKKREVANYYDQLFAGTNVKTPFISPGCYHVFNSYVIEVDRRDELRKYLSSKGVATAVYYPLPLPYQPCFKFLGYKKGDFPHSERASERSLAIPCYADITKTQQEYVAKSILDFYK